ncbi:MAG: flavin reductase family protein [Desulfobacter sp.]|nr:MAG: flavin reductase family protein [Desulfobacter sp.]
MLFKPFMREGFMPLPVTFVSSISADGIPNIAPYSCVMPVLRPLDLICLASAEKRDTLANIRETDEFVVNLVGEQFTDKVIPTARFSIPEENEFELAGLSQKPSEEIRPPGIAGAYAWMECRLAGFHRGEGYTLVMGKVVRLEVDDACLTPDGSLDLDRARPLMMTGSKKGMHYCSAADLGRLDPFGAMFPDGRDPLAKTYEEK